MWITMTIVFAILLLVCISINSDHAREIQALRYMNDYLLDEVVKTKGYNGLEEYIQHIDNYRRELKMREYELLESHEPDNAGAGKSNLPGNPIERCAIKKFSDNRYNTLRNIVNGVDRLIDESDEDTLELLRFRYWDCPIGCYEWEDIAHYFGTSKTSILRRRNALIDKLAKYIGYV